MEHDDGSYGYPPYGDDKPDGSDPYGGDRPYGQSSYGQAPYDQRPYPQAPYGGDSAGYRRSSYGYDAGDDAPRSNAGRSDYRSDEYSARDDSGRTYYPRRSEERASYDDDDEPRPPRPKKRKKKRSKFARFMRALGLYLAQLPARTLVVVGGSIAMVLVAVILLAVLLPKQNENLGVEDGQLAISNVTPTPSLAPTDTPGPTPPPTDTPNPDPLGGTRIEKAGEISDLMPDIQKRLVELGYMSEPEGGFTTKYGPATKTAIRLFQVKNFESSKDWDGIIGSGTYNLLMSDQARAYYLARGDGDDRTKVITKLVEDVTALQNRLITLGYLPAGSATGLFGSTTVTAVQKFQQYHGLKADGWAGQQTLQQLYSADAMDAVTGKANDRSKLTPSPSADVGDTTTTPDPNATATVPAP